MVSLEALVDKILELTWVFAFLVSYLVWCVSLIIHTTEWITSHMPLVFLIYLAMFYVLVDILSTIMTVWRKESAKNKPIEELSITDVDFIEPALQPLYVQSLDASFMERLQVKYGNFLQFWEYNFGYKTLAHVGIAFEIIAAFMFYVYLITGRSSKDYLTPLILVVFGALYIGAVFYIANNRRAYIKQVEYYEPFSEEVNVPMKIMAAKILAACRNEGFLNIIQVAAGYLFIVCGVCIFVNLIEISEAVDDVCQGYLSRTVIDYMMYGIVLIYYAAGMFLIYRTIEVAKEKVKLNLLFIMEQNWQRNRHALKYLFPEVEESSLEELVTLLTCVRLWPNPRQFNILIYLSLPLWKPKKGFCERNKRPFVDDSMKYISLKS